MLQKPGKLTEEERAVIKLHPQIGKAILEKVDRFRDYLPIVELHHEDYDGSGYPHGLKGKEVPLGARIVHVADVFDAVTSNRAYRKAMSSADVLAIMTKGADRQFDPAILSVFLDMWTKGELAQAALDKEVCGTESVLEVLATPTSLTRACSHYVNIGRVRCMIWRLPPSSMNEFRIVCRCSAAMYVTII